MEGLVLVLAEPAVLLLPGAEVVALQLHPEVALAAVAHLLARHEHQRLGVGVVGYALQGDQGAIGPVALLLGHQGVVLGRHQEQLGVGDVVLQPVVGAGILELVLDGLDQVPALVAVHVRVGPAPGIDQAEADVARRPRERRTNVGHLERMRGDDLLGRDRAGGHGVVHAQESALEVVDQGLLQVRVPGLVTAILGEGPFLHVVCGVVVPGWFRLLGRTPCQPHHRRRQHRESPPVHAHARLSLPILPRCQPIALC